MDRDAYSNTIDDIVWVVTASLVVGLVEVNPDWNLGDIPLWSNSGVHTNFHVKFTAIHTQCHELSLPVPDNASNMFGLAKGGLDATQESGEARTQVAASEAVLAKPFANSDALESQERSISKRIGFVTPTGYFQGLKEAS